jgi:hypothetical protein
VTKRSPELARFDAALRLLNKRFPEDLFLPSLRQNPARVQGYAFRFFLVLPIHSDEGKPVFTKEHIRRLVRVFNFRFGGSLASASLSGAPYIGEYLPEGENPVRDHHTVMYVYANPIEPSDRFFQELKPILRRAPLIPQDEILIERSEVFLI